MTLYVPQHPSYVVDKHGNFIYSNVKQTNQSMSHLLSPRDPHALDIKRDIKIETQIRRLYSAC